MTIQPDPQQPQQPAPAPVAQPAPVQYAAAPPATPGKGLAIAGLILAILVPIVGLIISIIAAVKLKKSGGIGLAVAGIIIGALFSIGWIVGIGVAMSAIGGVVAACAQLGPGVWEVNGVTYTCG